MSAIRGYPTPALLRLWSLGPLSYSSAMRWANRAMVIRNQVTGEIRLLDCSRETVRAWRAGVSGKRPALWGFILFGGDGWNFDGLTDAPQAYECARSGWELLL